MYCNDHIKLDKLISSELKANPIFFQLRKMTIRMKPSDGQCVEIVTPIGLYSKDENNGNLSSDLEYDEFHVHCTISI